MSRDKRRAWVSRLIPRPRPVPIRNPERTFCSTFEEQAVQLCEWTGLIQPDDSPELAEQIRQRAAVAIEFLSAGAIVLRTVDRQAREDTAALLAGKELPGTETPPAA